MDVGFITSEVDDEIYECHTSLPLAESNFTIIAEVAELTTSVDAE